MREGKGEREVLASLWVISIGMLLYASTEVLFKIATSSRRSSTPTMFNPSWEQIYFTQFENAARSLICNKILNVIRKYNLQRHYENLSVVPYRD